MHKNTIMSTFLFLFLCTEIVLGGKSASKAGLAGLTQIGGSSTKQGWSIDDVNVESEISRRNLNESSLRYLKYVLFQKQGYDKAVRPVRNKSDVIDIEIDITYAQILSLNEKEQTLQSLLRYRMYWKDQFLSWDPIDYDGITHIWLPSRTLWMPDVVAIEETGTRDFQPRIPFIVVDYEGSVRYLEPVNFLTTCPIKIAYFPFDTQICTLTFLSWTFPTSKLDLMSRRSQNAMQADIETYFGKTGEWRLDSIGVKKVSQSYMGVLSVGNESINMSEHDHRMMTQRYYDMSPQTTVRSVAQQRITDNHWSEVTYTLKFRRNSSLYIQSMLFPAVLLTTISMLGFYLPPDSGERIGLQITILLTFMVFILTVGDMFPASSGPYLGLYFVLCMGLLGLNIIMTVLVLHIHYMSCKQILVTDPITGESSSNMSVLPVWIKFGLLLTGVYSDLKTFAIPPDKLTRAKRHEKSVLGSIINKWKIGVKSQSQANEKNESTAPISNPGQTMDQTNKKNLPGSFLSKISDSGDFKRTKPNQYLSKNEKLESKETEINEEKSGKSSTSNRNLFAMNQISNGLTKLILYVSTLVSNSEFSTCRVRQNVAEMTMEEKWKSVARKVDYHCMILYISLMIFFHVVIATVIVLDA